MEKAFVNFQHNGVHLNFPNGNQVSMIWGWGSHTDNYGVLDTEDVIREMNTFKECENVELMISCGDVLHKRLMKKFNGDGLLINMCGIEDWLYIVNAVAKEKPDKTPTQSDSGERRVGE